MQFFLTLFKRGGEGGQTHVQKIYCKFCVIFKAFWQHKLCFWYGKASLIKFTKLRWYVDTRIDTEGGVWGEGGCSDTIKSRQWGVHCQILSLRLVGNPVSTISFVITSVLHFISKPFSILHCFSLVRNLLQTGHCSISIVILDKFYLRTISHSTRDNVAK